MQQGQASLEYLMLLAAVLCFFSALAPLLQNSYALSLYSIDVNNARHFSERLQLKVDEMRLFANGSSSRLMAKPIEEWQLTAKGNSLFISVRSTTLQAEKSFGVEFPNNIVFNDAAITEETAFLLVKTGNSVLIEHHYSDIGSVHG